MNHALVAADADAVEQTGGGGCAPLRAYVLVTDAVSQMRVADQPHRLARPLSRTAGAVSMSARPSPVRAGPRRGSRAGR